MNQYNYHHPNNISSNKNSSSPPTSAAMFFSFHQSKDSTPNIQNQCIKQKRLHFRNEIRQEQKQNYKKQLRRKLLNFHIEIGLGNLSNYDNYDNYDKQNNKNNEKINNEIINEMIQKQQQAMQIQNSCVGYGQSYFQTTASKQQQQEADQFVNNIRLNLQIIQYYKQNPICSEQELYQKWHEVVYKRIVQFIQLDVQNNKNFDINLNLNMIKSDLQIIVCVMIHDLFLINRAWREERMVEYNSLQGIVQWIWKIEEATLSGSSQKQSLQQVNKLIETSIYLCFHMELKIQSVNNVMISNTFYQNQIDKNWAMLVLFEKMLMKEKYYKYWSILQKSQHVEVKWYGILKIYGILEQIAQLDQFGGINQLPSNHNQILLTLSQISSLLFSLNAILMNIIHKQYVQSSIIPKHKKNNNFNRISYVLVLKGQQLIKKTIQYISKIKSIINQHLSSQTAFSCNKIHFQLINIQITFQKLCFQICQHKRNRNSWENLSQSAQQWSNSSSQLNYQTNQLLKNYIQNNNKYSLQNENNFILDFISCQVQQFQKIFQFQRYKQKRQTFKNNNQQTNFQKNRQILIWKNKLFILNLFKINFMLLNQWRSFKKIEENDLIVGDNQFDSNRQILKTHYQIFITSTKSKNYLLYNIQSILTQKQHYLKQYLNPSNYNIQTIQQLSNLNVNLKQNQQDNFEMLKIQVQNYQNSIKIAIILLGQLLLKEIKELSKKFQFLSLVKKNTSNQQVKQQYNHLKSLHIYHIWLLIKTINQFIFYFKQENKNNENQIFKYSFLINQLKSLNSFDYCQVNDQNQNQIKENENEKKQERQSNQQKLSIFNHIQNIYTQLSISRNNLGPMKKQIKIKQQLALLCQNIVFYAFPIQNHFYQFNLKQSKSKQRSIQMTIDALKNISSEKMNLCQSQNNYVESNQYKQWIKNKQSTQLAQLAKNVRQIFSPQHLISNTNSLYSFICVLLDQRIVEAVISGLKILLILLYASNQKDIYNFFASQIKSSSFGIQRKIEEILINNQHRSIVKIAEDLLDTLQRGFEDGEDQCGNSQKMKQNYEQKDIEI